MIDTSAWVEFLRDTGSPACDRVDTLLGGELAVCEPVVMELLAGAQSEAQLGGPRRLMARSVTLPTA